MIKKTITLSVALSVLLTMTGCGGSSSSSTSNSASASTETAASTDTTATTETTTQTDTTTDSTASSDTTDTASDTTASESDGTTDSATDTTSDSTTSDTTASDTNTTTTETDTTTSDTNTTTTVSGTVERGYIVDAAVANLKYKCPSSATDLNVTGSDGSFTYVTNNECSFYVGSVKVLSRTFSDNEEDMVFSPKDLLNAPDFSDYKVVNLAGFLWAVDDDGDPSNGIVVDEAKVLSDVTELTLDDADAVKAALVDSASFDAAVANVDDLVAHMIRSEIEALKEYQPDKAVAKDLTMLPNIKNGADITYDKLKNKTLQFDDITVKYYDDGVYEVASNDGSWKAKGFWTVSDDKVLAMFGTAADSSGANFANMAVVVFETFDETSGTASAYIYKSDGLHRLEGSILSNSGDPDRIVDVTNRLEISRADFLNKQIVVDDPAENVEIKFYGDGRYYEKGSSRDFNWEVEGTWTVVDNFLIVFYKSTTSSSTDYDMMVWAVKGRDGSAVDLAIITNNDGTFEVIDQPGVPLSDITESVESVVYTKVAKTFDDLKDKKLTITDSTGTSELYLFRDGSYIQKGSDWKTKGVWGVVDGSVVLTGVYDFENPKPSTSVIVDFDANGKFYAAAEDGMRVGDVTISDISQ